MKLARQWDREPNTDLEKEVSDLRVFIDRFGEELKDAEAANSRKDTDYNDGYMTAMRWMRDELRQAGIIQ